MPELRSRARTAPVWLYGRLLRDAPGIPDSTRVQRRRYRFGGGCFQINLALSARPRFADSQLDGGGGSTVGRGLNELITSTRQSEDELLPTHPSIPGTSPPPTPTVNQGDGRRYRCRCFMRRCIQPVTRPP
jgi:hypothetical protein